MDPVSVLEDSDLENYSSTDGRTDDQAETSVTPFNFVEAGSILNRNKAIISWKRSQSIRIYVIFCN